VTAPDQSQAPASAKSKTPWWAYAVVLGIAGIIALIVAHPTKHQPTSTENRDDATRACQEKFVPDRLKAPATAKFSNVTTTATAAGGYTVVGSVDSENGFGALIRSTFTCSVHSSGDQWVLDSATVN